METCRRTKGRAFSRISSSFMFHAAVVFAVVTIVVHSVQESTLTESTNEYPPKITPDMFEFESDSSTKSSRMTKATHTMYSETESACKKENSVSEGCGLAVHEEMYKREAFDEESAHPEETPSTELERFVLHRTSLCGNFWNKHNITYKIHSYPKSLNKHTTDTYVAHAFKAWSQYIPMIFNQLDAQDPTVADIDISFLKSDQNTSALFTSGYSPKNYIHIKDEEKWKLSNDVEGEPLVELLVYVVGRILGLPLTNKKSDRDSVMSGQLKYLTPRAKDICGIMSMYGPKYFLRFSPKDGTLFGSFESIRS